jgi:CRISPR/Cas system-associated exonuclease Cas4 (RecB family)
MQITHKSEMVQKFAEIMMEDFSHQQKDRSGIHRSDAIACPLKAYWRLTGQLRAIYDSQNVGILLIGTLAHIALHRNFDAQEEQHDYHGIKVTIDAILGIDSGVTNGKRYPIESKTTRKRIYSKGDIPQEWLEQLGIAMGVLDVDIGYLMVFNVIAFSITVWEIYMPKEERQLFLDGSVYQISTILTAVKEKKPELLQPKTVECHFCGYRPMRKRPEGCPYYKADEKKKEVS